MYENSVIRPKQITQMNKDTGTIKVFEPGTIYVFDEFIKSGEKYFCITDNFAFLYNDTYYSVNFVISKKETNENIPKSNITISEFKKIYTLSHHKELDKIINCLDHNRDDFKLDKIPKISLPVFDFICTFANIFFQYLPYDNKSNVIIEFPTSITLNAQSSKDRWYGNYNWYGDTTQFLIIGYIIDCII